MDIEKELKEKLDQMGDINRTLMDLQKKIGALQEEGKAIYNKGLELKGGIDMLLSLQEKEKAALAQSKTAGLTLPVGCKPVIAETHSVPLEVTPSTQDVIVPGLPVEPLDIQVPGAEAAPSGQAS
jgi:hypothetical protein